MLPGYSRLLWLLLVLACAVVQSVDSYTRRRIASAPAGCTYPEQQNRLGGVSTMDWAKASSAFTHAGGSFTASSSYGLRRVTIWLSRAQLLLGANVQAQIYTMSGTTPDTLLATSTTAIDADTISDVTETPYDFDFASDVALTSGTQYAIIGVVDQLGAGNSTLVMLYNGVGIERVWRSTNGTSWNQQDGTAHLEFRAYSCN